MKSFISLTIILVVFAFFLPNLLSTEVGNRFLSFLIEKKTGIQVGSATLSWSGPQIFGDLSYIKEKKRITAKELKVQKRDFNLKNLDVWLVGHHISGDQISLSIEGDYSIPLFSFSFEKVQIPNMTLKLGKMVWQNFGAVRDLLSILQLKIATDADIPLWFQETPASITNGILHFERTEVLLDKSYEFAIWNDIDLVKKEFNLVLGIPQSTIQKVLDIRGIPKDFTIPMRLTGPFNNPSLHKSSALKTVATLLLLQKLPLAPLPKVKASPPARRPFPWKQ